MKLHRQQDMDMLVKFVVVNENLQVVLFGAMQIRKMKSDA